MKTQGTSHWSKHVTGLRLGSEQDPQGFGAVIASRAIPGGKQDCERLDSLASSSPSQAHSELSWTWTGEDGEGMKDAAAMGVRFRDF